MHHAGFKTVAHRHRRHFRGKLGGELIVNHVLYKNAIGAHTGLPGVAELGSHRAFHRRIDVRVVKHDKRRVAAKFERDFFHRARALRHQQLADLSGTGKGEFTHQLVRGEFFAHRAGGTGDHRDHTFGYPRALSQFTQRQRRKRCLRCGLDDHGATGGKRRAGLARDHRIGKVPRRHRRAHADRLLDDDDALIGRLRRNHVAIHALAFLGEPFDERCAIANFAARFGQRLALLQRHQHGQIFGIGHHQLEPFAQDRRALLGGFHAPQLEGFVRRFDGAARFRRAQFRYRAHQGAVRRVVNRERGFVVGIHPCAVDVALLPKQAHVFQLNGRFDFV